MSNSIPMRDKLTQFDPLTTWLNKSLDDVFIPKKPQDVKAPEAPLPPAIDPNAGAARDAAVAEERKKRFAASKSVITNPTGGLGITSSSGAVAKQLLGA